MGLEKAIIYGKEHRKPYKGSKAIDVMCRNNGGCPWCEGNRLYQKRRLKEKEQYAFNFMQVSQQTII